MADDSSSMLYPIDKEDDDRGMLEDTSSRVSEPGLESPNSKAELHNSLHSIIASDTSYLSNRFLDAREYESDTNLSFASKSKSIAFGVFDVDSDGVSDNHNDSDSEDDDDSAHGFGHVSQSKGKSTLAPTTAVEFPKSSDEFMMQNANIASNDEGGTFSSGQGIKYDLSGNNFEDFVPEDSPRLRSNQPNTNLLRSLSSSDRSKDKERVQSCSSIIKEKVKTRLKWILGLFVIAISVASILMSKCLGRVQPTFYGVQYDFYRKSLGPNIKTPGLHWGPFGYRFIKFNSIQFSTDISDTCLSRDGLPVEIEVKCQYRLDKNGMLNTVTKYRDAEVWGGIVAAAGNSAIQKSCSLWNATAFMNRREDVQTAMLEMFRSKVEGRDVGLSAIVSSLNLVDAVLPDKYTNAAADKEAAKEDVARVIKKRIQEVTKAETELLAAELQAQMMMDSAYNEGNITITLANRVADHVAYSFEQEKLVLSQAQNFLSLNARGVLGYMTNRLYGNSKSLAAKTGAPTTISLKDEL